MPLLLFAPFVGSSLSAGFIDEYLVPSEYLQGPALAGQPFANNAELFTHFLG